MRAARRPRGRVSILARLKQALLGGEPDYRRLGALVKQAGGGLDGALAVAQAIEQTAARGTTSADPLAEVERLLTGDAPPVYTTGVRR